MNITAPIVESEIVQPTALEAISNAEINQSIATARRFPRNLPAVKLAMMSFATLDQETAESCFYTLPRGGKNIQGPSVRLAEIAISCYGNLRVASRIIETVSSGDAPHVTIQAVAMDLEKNVSISIEKRRRIVGKKSRGGAIDEDDINLASNAGSAIALRDAVFKVVPLALIKPVFEAARKVAIGDERTLADRRAKAIETFAKMGVPKERVLHKMEKKSIEEIGLAELETLIGFYNAIKEGEVRIDEAFPNLTEAKTSDLAPKMPSAPPTAPVAPANQQTKAEPVAQPQPTAVASVTCRFCGEEVKDMAGHECGGMREAMRSPNAPAPAPAQQAQPIEPEPTQAAAPAFAPEPMPTPNAPDNDALESVRMLAKQSMVSEKAVMLFCQKNKLAKKEQKELSELASGKLLNLIKAWENIKSEIQKIETELTA